MTFQLTTSHRGRLNVISIGDNLESFQLTTSHRGRPLYFSSSSLSQYFNSLPHTEVDTYSLASLYDCEYFNSLPHTEVDSNLSQNSERTSMNHITNRTINLYFFHFKHLITITKRKKAVFFWCESPRKIMCTLH